MRVKEFKDLKSCSKQVMLNSMIEESNKRPLLLYEAIRLVSDALKIGMDDITIADSLKKTLVYKDEWYESSFQRGIYEKDDFMAFMRFVGWFKTQHMSVLETNVRAIYVSDGKLLDKSLDKSLSQNVSLVCKDQKGNNVAFVIVPSKANHSPNGKSVSTNTSSQLELLVAKLYLERSYPSIKIHMVHLTSELDEDGAMYPEFIISNTKKSNLFTASFDSYELKDGFDFEALELKIKEVVKAPVEAHCFDCKRAGLCKAKTLQTSSALTEKEEAAYKLPKYTEEQQAVISATEGPVVACAGPGSGKTATLVGRIKCLMNKGVRPENILTITYTKKAAMELEERVAGFTKDMPFIMTINALGNTILSQNKQLLDRNVKLMSPVEKQKLIKNLLMALPQISGIKYGKMYGRTGLLKTVERKLDVFFSLGDYSSFRKKEPKLGEDFYAFAETFKEAVEANGYITYDEQITLCIKLFREHPDVLKTYQNLFKYIMVDEFQDVNKDNAEFIYMIADAHDNLCVVGDDDQAIYGFRGGDPDFMFRFPERFPSARCFVLSTNFRSSEDIVAMAEKLVEGNERISKEIKAHRGKGKLAPMTIVSEKMEKLLVNLHDNYGYDWGDMAILSTKNAPLETLKESLSIPCVLAKAFLVKEPFFMCVRNILSLYYEGLDKDEYLAGLLCTLYPDELFVRNKSLSLYETIKGVMPDVTDTAYYLGEGEGIYFKVLSILAKCFKEIELAGSSIQLIKSLAHIFECEGAEALQAIKDLIEERDLKRISEFYEHINYMVLMEDTDAKVELNPSDAVMLITSHESKGKEWPVVILQNGEDYTDEENSRRLMYVACTRAKDLLFLCHKAGTQINLSGATLEEVAV